MRGMLRTCSHASLPEVLLVVAEAEEKVEEAHHARLALLCQSAMTPVSVTVLVRGEVQL